MIDKVSAKNIYTLSYVISYRLHFVRF